MEWISHGVTGALVGNVILPAEDRPRHAAAWWVTAALAPDWLGAAVHGLGEAHRGVMHSLYALPVLALLFALAARRWSGNPNARTARLWVAFVAVIASHLVLDALTCYRYNPAWPFVRTDWSVGIMPMFDIYVFAGWLLLAVFRFRRRALQSTAAIGLAIFAAAVLVRGAGKLRADSYATSALAGGGEGEVRSVPDYFRPWVWYVRPQAYPYGWWAVDVIGPRALNEVAPKDPRRIGIGFGGL
jgi:membrane-bound metal-dependent hydrolase YbcI (DUF457 family)